MAWVKIDDQFYAHPKLVAAGPLAKSLYVDALCYANQYLTDGFIPRLVARQIAMPLEEYCPDSAAMIAKLVDAGLWSEIESGYQIHDYLEYNPSRESVLKDRAAAKERMQAARGVRRDKNVETDGVRQVFAGTSPEQNAKFAGSSPNPVPGPVPDVLSEQETLTPPTPKGDEPAPEGEKRYGLLVGGKGAPTKRAAKKIEYPPEFERWWELYPRKDDKSVALKAWKSLNPDPETQERMIVAIRIQAQNPRWYEDGGQYCPLPTTWINKRRWENGGVTGALAPPLPQQSVSDRYREKHNVPRQNGIEHDHDEFIDVTPKVVNQ